MLRAIVGPTALIMLGLVLLLLVAGALATVILAKRIERRFPPIGTFLTVDGVRLHLVDEGPREAPAVLLIHGASSNIRDVLGPARLHLGGRFRLIAIDRPGHGWSERGTGHDTPAGQARLLARALDALGVDKAIIKGHSFGAAVATALAVERPDKVAGLIVSAPATHPWPSGRTNWYNHLARAPVIGWLFTRTLALPAGMQRLAAATRCVFSPNPMPETYLDNTGIALVLTPDRFMHNSTDLTGLHAHVTAYAPRYRDITAPAIIITGDKDGVVSPWIHALPLAKAIPGAELLMVPGVGHKPDYALATLTAAAIEHLSGVPQDLEAVARSETGRIATERSPSPTGCTEPFTPVSNPA
ncbi:MAG: alpha/beta hydrolase [Rhizobiaceae bacterium]|jgi:pimeloyl-ACP methyl ester carboxylesterase|nr:alpha/beta hydrolase [Rhizobiaceae bacterium]